MSTLTRKISFECESCQAWQTLEFGHEQKELQLQCGYCQNQIHLQNLDQNPVETCLYCKCTDLYQHKDFNKKVGIGLFVVGAIFAPWTYYLSLIGALLVDAALFPFFPWMQVCYQCHSEFRGWSKNEKLDRFNHETAAHYEYSPKNKSKDKATQTQPTV